MGFDFWEGFYGLLSFQLATVMIAVSLIGRFGLCTGVWVDGVGGFIFR